MSAGLTRASVPRLAAGVRLQHSRARGGTVLLAPERVFTPDAVAVEVLELLDGARSVADVAAVLAASYDADAATIERDVLALLADLADKGVIAA
ncbi:pyrroloquinoline quinone biosynthesis protein D [Limimonas halophila]|uniref:Pyrroloquinoline quinone biosynthesis protein D n=1 Tax=Limimonas halophila TaxID=1082479 RepID=A0A1G7RIM4_9PROT|nr:pyrroloquinoline quinone biosynthesis peptide chaperone PqqD [Limimonas halophila]SDG10627.1 pyrroloquinoline quinone biosynthesis protein D [Limimonas halophila]